MGGHCVRGRSFVVDWPALTGSIAAAARISFGDLLTRADRETFYAFALYTDADAYTVLPTANSVEKFNDTVVRAGVEDARGRAGYRWSIGEWAYEAWQSDAFQAICEELSAASQRACEAGTFTEFRQCVHGCMIDALASLDAGGLFAAIRERIVLFVSSSDADEAFDLENRSARVLNSAAVCAEFLKRYDAV
jgi:hypothetical protein